MWTKTMARLQDNWEFDIRSKDIVYGFSIINSHRIRQIIFHADLHDIIFILSIIKYILIINDQVCIGAQFLFIVRQNSGWILSKRDDYIVFTRLNQLQNPFFRSFQVPDIRHTENLMLRMLRCITSIKPVITQHRGVTAKTVEGFCIFQALARQAIQ